MKKETRIHKIKAAWKKYHCTDILLAVGGFIAGRVVSSILMREADAIGATLSYGTTDDTEDEYYLKLAYELADGTTSRYVRGVYLNKEELLGLTDGLRSMVSDDNE